MCERESGKLLNMEQMKRSTRCARRRPELNNRHHSWSYQCSLSIIPGLCFCSATNRNELLSLSSLTSECFTPRQENNTSVGLVLAAVAAPFIHPLLLWRRRARDGEEERVFFCCKFEKKSGKQGGSRWCGGSEPANGKSVTEESNTQIQKLHKGERNG